MIPDEKSNLWTIGPATRSTRAGVYVVARCDCGTEREVLRSSILRGESRSCGCARASDPLKRFMSHVTPGPGGCWLWTGALNEHGYGRFYHPWNKPWKAHRFAYAMLRGQIPDGLALDHICRVRACVNPDHLRPMTLGENVLIGVGPSAINARKTHCRRGHAFTPENTQISNGQRRCRTCRREAKRAERVARKTSAAA